MRPGLGIPTMSRRAKRVLTAVVVLVVLAILWFQFVGVYVDFLWFGEVGFREVFTTQALTRIVLFLVVGVVAAGLVLGAMVVAYRSRPVFVPSTNEQDPLAPYRIVISSRPRLIAIVAAVLVGLISGISAQGNWQTVQLFLHGGDFGKADPQFGHDIGFYVFRLPLIQMVLGWLFVITAICAVIVAVVQYLFGGLRTQGAGRKVTSAATLQLSLLVGFFVLIKAVQYWFDRYNLLFSDRSGIFTGASYTDVNAVLPAKIILMVIAGICAVGFIVGAILRSIKLPALAVALLVLSSVLIGGLWPLILQQVVVKPNANSREPVYISKNIDATRTAFGIGDDKVTYVDNYSAAVTSTPTDIADDKDTVPNARLLDPNVLSPTFTQQQQVKNYYGFANQLSVDRYTIDGDTQDYLVAARELSTANLFGQQNDWIQRHLVYTHGDGILAAPANEVSNGYPNYKVSDLSNPKGFVDVTEPRIYYGQLTTDYSIVGTAANVPAREQDTDGSTYTYAGRGGVSVGNLFQRLVFATNYSEMNFLFSSGINSNSKIMYNRDPRERVSKAAPFLTTDTKPYPAVVGGRIVWIVDGYTTAANYPYSQSVAFGEATTNSLTARGPGQIDSSISYIRNSVKATVDAYDGTVTLYEVDSNDPVLKAWEGVFPGLVQPESAVSDELRAHFRYPEDLFEVQRSLLTKYNVTDPINFFNNSGFWKVPNDPTSDTNLPQPAYYLQVKLPGEEGSEFHLTSVLNGLNREYMAAYMAASSDPKNYGKISVLRLPTNTQTPGPAQVQTLFRTKQEISELVTLSQQSGGARVIFGNLLTLPVNNSLLYVEPFYIQGGATSAAPYPQLNYVLVWYGNQVGVGKTLAEALKNAVPAATPADPNATPSSVIPSGTQSGGVPSGGPTTTGGTGVQPSTEAGARTELQDALQELEAAKVSQDQGRIGAANKRLEAAVDAYLKVGGSSGAVPSSAPAVSRSTG
ncbi:MAG: UPF0182 family protein [Nakamurella sp.]